MGFFAAVVVAVVSSKDFVLDGVGVFVVVLCCC